MHKLFVLTMGFFMFVAVTGCGGKYSDVKEVNEQYIAAVNEYISDMGKAEDAKQVAAAMNSLADKLEVIMPKMRELQDKYPELKDSKNPPEELEGSYAKAESVGKKLVTVMMSSMMYFNNPEVRRAQERLTMAMAKE